MALSFWSVTAPAADWGRCVWALVAPNRVIDPRLVEGGGRRLELSMHDPAAPGVPYLDAIPALFGAPLGVEPIRRAYRRFVRDTDPTVTFFERALRAFDAETDVVGDERIPRTGPLLVVANHPRFGVETMGIAARIQRARPDVKVVFTQSFETLPGAAENGISVATVTAPDAGRRNVEAVRRMIEWLRGGHVLVIHPAGGPSSVTYPTSRHVFDRPWAGGILRILRQVEAPVLPVHVDGSPSATYLAACRWTTWAGSLLLLSELGRVEGARMRLSFGEPVSHAALELGGRPGEDRQAAGNRVLHELRRRTYGAAGIVEPE